MINLKTLKIAQDKKVINKFIAVRTIQMDRMKDLAENRKIIMISNKKQIEQALRLLYLIWIMIHYFLINGHCTWEVITEKRN